LFFSGDLTIKHMWCNQQISGYIWLVGGDWNMWIILSIQLGMEKSSQLTFTPSFFRGVGQPTSWEYDVDIS
jgi:hypothetical protein